MAGLMSLLRRRSGGEITVPAIAAAGDTSALNVAARLDKPTLQWAYNNFTAFGTLNYWPNPDEVLLLHGSGEGLGFYRRIRRQVPYVAGLFKLRIDSVMALPHNWVAGDPDDDESVAVRDAIADAWANLDDRDAALRKLLICIADGVAFAELVWSLHEVTVKPKPKAAPKLPPPVPGLQPPDVSDEQQAPVVPPVLRVALLVPQIIDRRTDHFFFDAAGGVHFKVLGSPFNNAPLDPLQVITARYGSAELWGDGEMRECYTDIWKIDTIDKMALRALEKQGYPLLKVTVPESWDADRVAAMKISIQASYPNYIVLPFGDKIDFSFPDQGVMVTYLGRDQLERIVKLQDTISIAILGVSFSTSDKGSRARDQVRNELRFEKTSTDAGSYDAIAQDWCGKCCQVNYPSLPDYLRPRMMTDAKPTGDVVAWANTVTAMDALGFPISQKQVSEKLGLDVAQTPEDTLVAKTPPKPVAIPGGSMQGVNPADAKTIGGDVTVMSESGEVYSFSSMEEFREATGL